MCCLFLNIHDFGVPGRRTLLKDLLRNHRINIICFQETIKQYFTDLELGGMEVGERFFWSWLFEVGTQGGCSWACGTTFLR